MTELLTAAQMRAIEKAAIDSGDITGLELMERAGQGVVEAIFEEWPELAETAGRAVVLCGPGNNGGDGFVVARLLKERGWEVEVFLYGDPEKLPPDARVNYERWGEIGDVGRVDLAMDVLQPVWPESMLIIDALFGTGLTRPLSRQLAENLDRIQGIFYERRLVSVDILSGVCADSGLALHSDAGVAGSGNRIEADLTVTFQQPKLGHFLNEGPLLCGKLKVAGIGLDDWRDQWYSLERPALVRLCTKRVEGSDQISKPSWEHLHKYSHGHALILSGSAGKTGAARLAARGALRIGAGLVTLGVSPSAQMEVASQITSLMLRRIEGNEGLSELLSDARLNALCLGPGLGLDRARDLVPLALNTVRATVLDADALSAFADAPGELFGMLHETCVLTPHGGEFARLFPDLAEKLNSVPTKGPAYSKVDATREAAKRAGCVVLFKGPDTVIAAPDGRCSVNSAHYERAAPWLATAGSGDVLAGFITGLLARGFAPMQAAETGAWLHVECARHFGPGLIAEDLPEQLPAVFRELGL
ncbi:NAD(P)H-hydrate dehydratase [Ruegeria hyattellae]|uniref:NAD(P)H-hydrate dehydratase n=1 Tax=Ruegeria hyattellae TaxID=3233337 RepID=UPI00355B13DA